MKGGEPLKCWSLTSIKYKSLLGAYEMLKFGNKVPVTRNLYVGKTVLHHAIENGHKGIINMLLGCPGSTECYRSLLHFYVSKGVYRWTLLIGHSVSSSVLDPYYLSPLVSDLDLVLPEREKKDESKNFESDPYVSLSPHISQQPTG